MQQSHPAAAGTTLPLNSFFHYCIQTSQKQPQWRLCRERLVDCWASPLNLKSDITGNWLPPQNSGPKGCRGRSNKDEVKTGRYSEGKRNETVKGKYSDDVSLGKVCLSSPVQ